MTMETLPAVMVAIAHAKLRMAGPAQVLPLLARLFAVIRRSMEMKPAMMGTRSQEMVAILPARLRMAGHASQLLLAALCAKLIAATVFWLALKSVTMGTKLAVMDAHQTARLS